jgi:hypothetical protein
MLISERRLPRCSFVPKCLQDLVETHFTITTLLAMTAKRNEVTKESEVNKL